MAKNKIILILHNIRSSHNVGSLFRTADAVGVSQIIISGYSPAPLDKFNRPNGEIAKTALGAEKKLDWIKVSKPTKVIQDLKIDGYKIIALEQDKKSVDFRSVKKLLKNKNIALVLGNEVLGVSPALLKQADIIAEIPMAGMKESLNVSVAGAIMLFALI